MHFAIKLLIVYQAMNLVSNPTINSLYSYYNMAKKEHE